MTTIACLGCGMLISKAKQSRCATCYGEWAKAKPNPYKKSRAWRSVSKRMRDEQPWCSRCATQGDASNPLSVDHLVPLAAGGALVPDDDEALQVLCRRCQGIVGSKPHAPGPWRA